MTWFTSNRTLHSINSFEFVSINWPNHSTEYICVYLCLLLSYSLCVSLCVCWFVSVFNWYFVYINSQFHCVLPLVTEYLSQVIELMIIEPIFFLHIRIRNNYILLLSLSSAFIMLLLLFKCCCMNVLFFALLFFNHSHWLININSKWLFLFFFFHSFVRLIWFIMTASVPMQRKELKKYIWSLKSRWLSDYSWEMDAKYHKSEIFLHLILWIIWNMMEIINMIFFFHLWKIWNWL